MIDISVIVPVYNVERYLDRCISSLINQSFKNLEIILVNDGSTDASGQICDNYKHLDNRIKVIHKTNGGLSDARNHGLSTAKGLYIAFIDGDDYIHSQMLEVLYNDLVKYDAEISCCNFSRVSEDKIIQNNVLKEFSKEKIFNGNKLIVSLSSNVEYVVAWNKLYKRELFNNLKYRVGVKHEDEYIIHHLFLKCNKVIYRDTALYYYVQRTGSIMDIQKGRVRVDLLCAMRDRWITCRHVISQSDSVELSSLYINCFFEQFFRYIHKGKQDKRMEKQIKSFRMDLISMFMNPNYTIKEKLTWGLFIISPSLYSRRYH